MTGREHLILSGGLVNRAFFNLVVAQASVVAQGRPTMLIDQQASPSEQSFLEGVDYYQKLQAVYGMRLMHLQRSFRQATSPNEALEKIEQADVLYVGGGSTRRLKQRWDALGISHKVVERVRSGELVASGASAGSLIWFEEGHSDSWQYEVKKDERWQYTKVAGVGVLPGRATVHYGDLDNLGRSRSESFRNQLYYERGLWSQAIGIETHTAIVSSDGVAHAVPLEGGDNSDAYAFYAATRDLPHRIPPGQPIGSLSAGTH